MPDTHDRLETVPVLPSLDLNRTVNFYEKLGFNHEWAGNTYVLLRKAEVELHYWLCDDPAICKTASCYIRGGKVDTWHTDFRAAKVKTLSPIKLQDWNMVEFHLFDPDGVLIRFGRVPTN